MIPFKFQLLAEVNQRFNGEFINSVIVVLIFLSVLCFLGYTLVQIFKHGGFVRNKGMSAQQNINKINILDNKFLYGRKYISLVECCGKRLLILVNHDNAVKLSEWEIKQDEAN